MREEMNAASEANHGAMGVQAIQRMLAILRLVSHSRGTENTLANVAKSIGLATSTTHRFLRYLTAEGLLVYDKKTRFYSIGPLLFELGLLRLPDVHSLLAPGTLDRVAQATGQ